MVQGSKAEAAVSVMYSKHGLLSEVIDFVAVDYLDSNGEIPHYVHFICMYVFIWYSFMHSYHVYVCTYVSM